MDRDTMAHIYGEAVPPEEVLSGRVPPPPQVLVALALKLLSDRDPDPDLTPHEQMTLAQNASAALLCAVRLSMAFIT